LLPELEKGSVSLEFSAFSSGRGAEAMSDATGSERKLSPEEEERRRVMEERVARREAMVKQRVQVKQHAEASRRAKWA
jgi:hypothetical protein